MIKNYCRTQQEDPLSDQHRGTAWFVMSMAFVLEMHGPAAAFAAMQKAMQGVRVSEPEPAESLDPNLPVAGYFAAAGQKQQASA